jgi:hypothetical protein
VQDVWRPNTVGDNPHWCTPNADVVCAVVLEALKQAFDHEEVACVEPWSAAGGRGADPPLEAPVSLALDPLGEASRSHD